MASVYDDPRTDERSLDKKPLSELVSDALRQLSGLVRTEIGLAKAELGDKAKQAASGGAMLGVAAVLSLPSLTVLMLAIAAIMVEAGVASWLAYLITAVIGLAAAGILAKVGLNRLKADMLMPNRTITQVQRDAATVREHI